MISSKNPFTAEKSICQYAMLSVDNSFYLFGGKSDNGLTVLSKIGRLDLSTKTWVNAGDLNSPKTRHGLAFIDSSFLVIGGSSTLGSSKTEKCTLINRQVYCTVQPPTLSKHSAPEVFIVTLDFCN